MEERKKKYKNNEMKTLVEIMVENKMPSFDVKVARKYISKI